MLVAAPAYLASKGIPGKPSDLVGHNCLLHSIKAPAHIWHLKNADEECPVQVSGTMRSNLGDILKSAALLGYGISMHPYYMVSGELASGRLVPVLQRYTPRAWKSMSYIRPGKIFPCVSRRSSRI